MDPKISTEATAVSLTEVHRSVSIPANVGRLRRMFAFAGPAYLVSVGYMDPGNWATDLEGGARFGYQLVWVILMSNAMAVLLQTLAARMGIATGRDLAQACREAYPRPVARMLWLLCEIAIAACDLAEVLGTAIGINLLFHLPLVYGVIITGADTLVFLMIQSYGIRKIEAFILVLVATMGVCFGIEMIFAKPDWYETARGFIPHLSSGSLYIAIGILGATVMPHNLYMHSALVQTRVVADTEEGKKQACQYNLWDTGIALNAAFLVNAAILILSASVFFSRGIVVTQIQQAHELLAPLLGTTLASTLFAVALIASGQSSTLTGTLAGQIVMEGFLHIRIRPWVRRLITRLLAIIPALIVISLKGEQASYELLILSQVILSLQLPFAVIPLIQFTSDRSKMGSFANAMWVRILAWLAAAIIVVLNLRLVVQAMTEWIHSAGPDAVWIWATAVPAVAAVFLLLLYISLPGIWRRKKRVVPVVPEKYELVPQRYTKIGIALDYGEMDAKVLSHASTLARQQNSEVHLFHVVEGVSGQLFGTLAYDDEARQDKDHLERIAERLRATGLSVKASLGFGRVPEQLIDLSRTHAIDLLVMGGHRHRGIKDIFFGASISRVRHALDIPVLVIQ